MTLAGVLNEPVLIEDEPHYEPEAPTYQEPEYRDWTSESTYVISGPVGNTNYKGERFPTWQQASAHVDRWVKAKRKTLYQFWTIPGRWFARVSR